MTPENRRQLSELSSSSWRINEWARRVPDDTSRPGDTSCPGDPSRAGHTSRTGDTYLSRAGSDRRPQLVSQIAISISPGFSLFVGARLRSSSCDHSHTYLGGDIGIWVPSTAPIYSLKYLLYCQLY
jgi:hypothetical protein